MKQILKMLRALRRRRQKELLAIASALSALGYGVRPCAAPDRRRKKRRYKNSWSAADEARLRELYPTTNRDQLAQLFGRTAKAVSTRAKVLGVRKAIGHGGRVAWTGTMDRQLRDLYAETPTRALVATLGASVLAINQRADKLGIRKSAAYKAKTLRECGHQVNESGRAHRFPKGNVPMNKGLRRPGWFAGRMRETQFKKGQVSINAMPLWSFRWYQGGSDAAPGYLTLKTGKRGKKPLDGWEYVHKLIWEQANGPLPDWKVARIWWKDRDHGNCALANLELVTAQEHMARTTVHTLPKPLAEVIQLRGALTRKLRRLSHGKEYVEGSAGSPVRDPGGFEGASRQAG